MLFRSKNADETVAKLQARIGELEEQNRRYREALEFYANPDHWVKGYKYRDASDTTVFTDSDDSGVEADKGLKARSAIKGE